MGGFNSDDQYIYYCGQKSLRRNGIVLIVNKRAQSSVLECNFKNDRMILVHPQGKSFNNTVIQVYAPTTDAEEAEVDWFYEDLQPLLLLLLLSRFSRVQLCATPWTAAHQAPPSLGFSRQEHRSGLPLPSPMHESEK